MQAKTRHLGIENRTKVRSQLAPYLSLSLPSISYELPSLATLASVLLLTKLFPNDTWLHWSLLFSYTLRIYAVTQSSSGAVSQPISTSVALCRATISWVGCWWRTFWTWGACGVEGVCTACGESAEEDLRTEAGELGRGRWIGASSFQSANTWVWWSWPGGHDARKVWGKGRYRRHE
jgi:hypothetical protein